MSLQLLTVGRALALLAVLCLGPLMARAQEQAAPAGEVLLTISGEIARTDATGVARFDRAMLEALEQQSFETTTIWTEGPQRFSGVSLQVLLEAVGAQGTLLRATALNDYAVEIPVSDAVPGGPLVAYLQNGAPMSVREKGPLWIVYPFDSSAAYQTEQTYARSIWQLVAIEVLP